MKASFLSIPILLISFFSHKQAQAQLCTGSLGDPVVNINFGQGNNPGPPLGSGITNYGYFSTPCPPDGFYNIGTASIACFNNTWHTVTEDHTPGDVNGYMMIVNASNNPGVFYVDTVSGLCGGTTYEFAAWIMNILKASSCNGTGIRPNVTFNIEILTGAVLLTSKTGDIFSGSPVWQQYGAFFTTPLGVASVVIRMTNNAPGGCGNDLLLDDITFRPCGAKVTSTVTGGGITKDLCVLDNQSVSMSATVSGADNNTLYQWQTSTDNGVSWNDVAGANQNVYTRPPNTSPVALSQLYRLTTAQGANIFLTSCRIASNNITVNVNALPVPAAISNSPRCEGDTLTFSASDGQTYNWTGPNGFTSNVQYPVVSPVSFTIAGKYFVTVVSAKGCVNNDSTTVVVNAKVTADAGADVTICQGTSTRLQGGTGVTYEWLPALGLSSANVPTPLAMPDTTTNYVLTVSNGQCKASDQVIITVLKAPTAKAGPDQKILEGQSIILRGLAPGENVTYNWTPPLYIDNPLALQPVVSPPRDTTYTLRVSSTVGCGSASDDVFVRVFKAIKIPNVFSPNNDGINDLWQIDALETYPEASLSVFNRYGQLVHSGNGISQPWNGTYKGKPLPVATYYYIIELKNGLDILKGSVLILR